MKLNQTPYYLRIFRFEGEEIQQYDVIMASSYVTVPIKLCLDAGNDEYIIRCNFVGRIRSFFEVIVGAAAGYPTPPPPPTGST